MDSRRSRTTWIAATAVGALLVAAASPRATAFVAGPTPPAGRRGAAVVASAASTPSIRLMARQEAGEGDADPRRQALEGVLTQIDRCYGRGSILKLGDNGDMAVVTTSTGTCPN